MIATKLSYGIWLATISAKPSPCIFKWRDPYHSRMHWRWNSCLQLVTYIRWSNWFTNCKFPVQHTKGNTTFTTYSHRITITKPLEAYATSIITRLLYPSLYKSRSWCQVSLCLLGLIHSRNITLKKAQTEYEQATLESCLFHLYQKDCNSLVLSNCLTCWDENWIVSKLKTHKQMFGHGSITVRIKIIYEAIRKQRYNDFYNITYYIRRQNQNSRNQFRKHIIQIMKWTQKFSTKHRTLMIGHQTYTIQIGETRTINHHTK